MGLGRERKKILNGGEGPQVCKKVVNYVGWTI